MDDGLDELLKEDSDSSDFIDLTAFGVCQKIYEQDPSVRKVTAASFGDDEFDWEEAGKSIGSSRYVKKLELILFERGMPAGIIPFCKGLSSNRSIERIYLFLDCHPSVATDLFDLMRPFFSENDKLVAFGLEYTDQLVALMELLRLSTSLNQVALYKRSSSIHPDERNLLRALISEIHLHRLFLTGNLIAENARGIKMALANPRCELKSLSLANIGGDLDNLSLIAKGLDNNSSIQHVAYSGKNPELLLQINSWNYNLTRLDLSPRHYIDNTPIFDQNLARSLRSFCALKTLDLSRCNFKTSALLSEVIKTVLRPLMRLEELILTDCSGLDDNTLLVLRSRLASGASSLKKLQMGHSHSITSEAWKCFFSHLRNCTMQLEHVGFRGNYAINDEVLAEFVRLLGRDSKLKSFDLIDCGFSQCGWDLLTSALRGTAIESLQCMGYYVGDIDVPLELRRLIGNGSLKEIALGSISWQVAKTVLSLTKMSSCSLRGLSFWCGVCTEQELMMVISSWVEMLDTDSTLETWHIDFQFPYRIWTKGIWTHFSRLLCNDNSIDATHQSNHTLSSLDFHFFHSGEDAEEELHYTGAVDMPTELHSLLQMNLNPDKAAVARRKVINAHFPGLSGTQKLLELDFGSHILPQLFSWIGRERTELSMMYSFIGSMPSLFKHIVSPSRKRMKLEDEGPFVERKRICSPATDESLRKGL
jgi:hypothetical protein